MESGRKLGVGKQTVFSLFTIVVVVAGINGLVEFGEEQASLSRTVNSDIESAGRAAVGQPPTGRVPTMTRDHEIQFLDAPIFTLTDDGWHTVADYARQECVPGRFRADKGDSFRTFLLGGSFAMGTPWVDALHGEERPGGMLDPIRAGLAAVGAPHEILNLGAGGQNSNRVRMMAREVAEHKPDAFIVATCNNEGALPPWVVESRLRRFGLYRLVSLAVGASAQGERSLYTAQDPDVDALRNAFRDNLRDIIKSAAKAGASVFLCTLPVNLLYQHDEWGHTISGYEKARGEEEKPCVGQARGAYIREEYGSAELLARECDAVEALRWRGLALVSLGRLEQATFILEQYTELVPRNRCRPSFNEVIREEASRARNVYLVDLDAHARGLSLDGLPGKNLFVDYCHLTRRGYTLMGEEIMRVMREARVFPR